MVPSPHPGLDRLLFLHQLRAASGCSPCEDWSVDTGGGKRGRKKPSGERALAGQQGMPGAPFRLPSGRRPLSGARLLW